MASALAYIVSVNDSASQLSHVQPMTVQDVYALVTLMCLYLSEASCHQKAYKELLACCRYNSTGRGLCGLVCPSRTSEHGEKGDCVKGGGGIKGKRVEERAKGRLLCHNPRH